MAVETHGEPVLKGVLPATPAGDDVVRVFGVAGTTSIERCEAPEAVAGKDGFAPFAATFGFVPIEFGPKSRSH
jgi:hypothetical protein